ncbi:hypothetical protein [Psychrobacillus sp. FJAT-21963]|uniref:hypothetical protein n=1 Tax=Psychrobacillus sp. FJAT-21963 TaxID=1712028 RepID=UPI0006F9E791|nr:hypothetical protein [Psychrobacillus sp. FJAT-21963]KQL35262.1 hypothetical protein AN959_10005 [Psychrobacillus sp. FJAT-21963]
MTLEFFPKYERYDIDAQNPQIQVYGHRIYKDQTLYEYLLEFLLVFVSPKSEGTVEYEKIKSDGFYFNEIKDEKNKLHYYPAPRMGLKRFIFFNRSDQEKRFEIDRYTLEHHREHLKQTISVEGSNYDKEFALDVLQDLFYGYNAIIGKRSWFAQSLLPLAPEIIFSESIGNKKTRTENLSKENSFLKIDREFNFSQHMFMARGGEVYYLHVLQGLSQSDSNLRDKLSEKLKNMITSIPQLSALANHIQGEWEEVVDAPDNQAQFHYLDKTMEVIPKSYENVAHFTVEELHNLLCSELDAFEKVELVGNLLAIQIIRMMTYRSTTVLNLAHKQAWVIDLTKNAQGSIRKKAVQGYEELEENVFRAIYRVYNEEMAETKKNVLQDAAKDTSLLIRKLGKDIGLVIPPTGGNMRMSLNENLVKILVLTLIKPGERLLFTTFLELCCEHYNIVIGPKEAEQHFEDISYLNDFNENEQIFLELLRNCGFLRNLSDATSIVENPFKG